MGTTPVVGWRAAPFLRTGEVRAVLAEAGIGGAEFARLVDTGALPCTHGPDGRRRFAPLDLARVLREQCATRRAATAEQPPLWGPGSRGGRP